MDNDNSERHEIRLKPFSPSSGDKTFEDLRAGGRLLEAFLYAWGTVETDVDERLLYRFGLLTEREEMNRDSKDPRIRRLLRHNFGWKIEFLHEMGALSNGNKELLSRLARKRNELFHGKSYKMRLLNMTEQDWQEHIELASSAVRSFLYPTEVNRQTNPPSS
jgi:hypothetical protein